VGPRELNGSIISGDDCGTAPTAIRPPVASAGASRLFEIVLNWCDDARPLIIVMFRVRGAARLKTF
ncbi:MAG: hypothetical protein ACE5I0_10125, partial [Candidatus Binatia bacterium]